MPGSLDGFRILIVEDELEIAELLVQGVKDAGGFVIGTAATEDEALRLVERGTVDAAILDLIVHGVYCDAIAAKLIERKVPFAVTTGIGADDDHPLLRDAPAITKPFQPQYVGKVLAGLLRN